MEVNGDHDSLQMSELLWNKPGVIKTQECELIAIYSQFLDLMKNEKAAKETYLKSIIANSNKVRDIRTKLEKDCGHKFVIMIDLLKIYGEVLQKLQENLVGEVSYMEANFISKLATSLKEDKVIKEKMQSSVDLIQKYMRQLVKIESCRRALVDSYITYEKTTMIDEAIAKVVRTYSDEIPKKLNDAPKNNYLAKEYEYHHEVKQFNEDAREILKSNSANLKRCSRYIENLACIVKEAAECAINFHTKSLANLGESYSLEKKEKLSKIDPLFELSSWVQCNMNDEQKIFKVETFRPRTYFSENIPKQKVDENVRYAENQLPELVFELFNQVRVEVDETSCLKKSPTLIITSTKQHMRELKNIIVKADIKDLSETVNKYSSWINSLSCFKAFADEASLSNVAFMIETVKKAWYFGQVLNSEFSKFITIIKTTCFLKVFPYILACFRLMDVNYKEMISVEGFKPLAELFTVALNQSAIQCEVFVPTELLTLAETYYAMPEQNMKVYILDYIRKNKIFSQKEFWETYLLWSINRNAKTIQHFARTSVDQNSLKKSAIDTVGSVFRSTILTMARAGLEKAVAQDIILGMIDKFKLDEGNRSLAICFLQNYTLENTSVPEEANAKLMLSNIDLG